MAARLPLLLLFALPLANGHCYSHNTQKSVNKTRDLQADLGREILAKSLEMFY